MRNSTLMLAGVALAIGTAAGAQAPENPAGAPTASPATPAAPNLTAGATIYDSSGAEAGKIDSVAGDLVVVSTGTNKISMPKSSFGAGPKGPTVSVTKAQIDAAAAQAAQQQAAALQAALVVGAPVTGSSGTQVGTVKSIAADAIIVDSAKGPVSVPRNAFSAASNGGLMIPMTAAEFEAAATAAGASAAK